jgi:hypothetical protein
MDINEMERKTILHAEQLLLAWEWAFDARVLTQWINQNTQLRVTCQQVAYVLYCEERVA